MRQGRRTRNSGSAGPLRKTGHYRFVYRTAHHRQMSKKLSQTMPLGIGPLELIIALVVTLAVIGLIKAVLRGAVKDALRSHRRAYNGVAGR